MAEFAQELIHVNIEDEMRRSYLDYAMSVIVGRALPDVRDGLKPVHRRVLFAMNELGAHHNKAYFKSARIVGDTIGKYHPHGDQAVYDALVRMAQPFSLRNMLVDGQGNFGSVDGDSAAAMRYTESRLSKIAHELLSDIDKETVDFIPNYDEKELEPKVLPTRVPNLLVNGSAGIAVGMATNIPPHNLTEVINATLALIDNPEIDVYGLMEHMPGPDFPTAGIINGSAGIAKAYATGRGRVLMRAKADIETDQSTGREAIIVTEIPYQVNKARLIEKIAELVKEKKIEGISEIRDESDKDGMRIYIEVKRGEAADVLLNNLYKQTQLQSSFGINMVALVDGRPQLLNLHEILDAFVRHRREVVTRRTIFELRKARGRAHILEGLTVALANIDEMVELIKTSANPAEAKDRMLAKRWEAGLVRTMLSAAGAHASRPEELSDDIGLFDDGYQLSDIQAQAILEMRLSKLTGLEQEKITDEYRRLLETIAGLIAILEDPDKLMAVIREELENLREEFGDERRTEIQENLEELDILDLIASEDVVVTLSHEGYIKRQSLGIYRAQRRGGKGRSAAKVKDEDFVEQLWIANTHDTLLTFTNQGKVYWLKVYQIPDAGPNAKGRPIINFLQLDEGEKIQAVLPVQEFSELRYVVFATQNGTIKKTPLSDYARPRSIGLRAINLDEHDGLVDVALTDGQSHIMLFASNGKAVRFDENAVRSMGRTARGVRGIRLEGDEAVVSLYVAAADDESKLIFITEHGYGKRTLVSDFPAKGRGNKGVIAIKTGERNGKLIGAVPGDEENDVMLISDQGTLVRTRIAEISTLGRNTKGVTIMKVAKGENLSSIVVIEKQDDEDEEGDEGVEASGQPDAPVAGDAEE